MSNDNHDDHGRFAAGSGGGPAHAGGHANSVPSIKEAVQNIAPAHASIHESSASWADSRTHAEAAKALQSAGFTKESGKQQTVSSKMGRSTAYSSAKVQTASYTHPSGHSAQIKTSTVKYGGSGPTTYYRFASHDK